MKLKISNLKFGQIFEMGKGRNIRTTYGGSLP